MHPQFRHILVVVALGLLLVVAIWSRDQAVADRQWQALYEQKFGQPVREMNTAVLDAALKDARGSQNSLGWAELEDGSYLLLGVPGYARTAEQIVEQTAVLEEDDAQELCEQALGGKTYGGGWSWRQTVGNSFVMYFYTREFIGDQRSDMLPDPDQPYCEFAYVADGWELRLVYNKGTVRAAQPGMVGTNR